MNEQNEHGVTPQTGQPARYVLADGQVRAATITNAFGGERVNLTVHLDGMNDVYHQQQDNTGYCRRELIPGGAQDLAPLTLSVGSASYDPAGTTPGTWHYPERA